MSPSAVTTPPGCVTPPGCPQSYRAGRERKGKALQARGRVGKEQGGLNGSPGVRGGHGQQDQGSACPGTKPHLLEL